jgi:hypothetical protein
MLIAIVAVMQLQLGSGERVALVFVILIGSISPAMSTLRFVKVYQAAAGTEGMSLPVIRQLLLWGKFEIVSAHYAFCLPAFRVFYRQCSGKLSKLKPVFATLSTGKQRSPRPDTFGIISTMGGGGTTLVNSTIDSKTELKKPQLVDEEHVIDLEELHDE